MSDTFATRNAGQPLEERVEIEVLSVDLREAVMACLSGGESCRWTVGELLERLKNLGVLASRASVTAALAELELELELASWAPWEPGVNLQRAVQGFEFLAADAIGSACAWVAVCCALRSS